MRNSDKQILETWGSVQDWLDEDPDGKTVLARFLANPQEEAAALSAWLVSHQHRPPATLATYVTGGQVDKIVNIAQAGVVLVEQTVESPPTALFQLPGD